MAQIRFRAVPQLSGNGNHVPSGVEQKRVACAGNSFHQPACADGDGDRTQLHTIRYSVRNVIKVELQHARVFSCLRAGGRNPEVVVKGKADPVRDLLGMTHGRKKRAHGQNRQSRQTKTRGHRHLSKPRSLGKTSSTLWPLFRPRYAVKSPGGSMFSPDVAGHAKRASAFRRRTLGECLGVPNRSFPGHPPTFSLWSRTRRITRPRADGASRFSTKTASQGTRRCCKPALRATRRP